MPPVKAAGGTRKLPPVSVARFEEALKLVDRIYEANVDSSLARLQDYRERHRDATQRPLTAEEAVRWAAVAHDILKDEPHTPAELQNSGLYEYDAPGAGELLLAGGLAIGQALLTACRQFVALVELPAKQFEEAYDSDMVAEAVEVAAARLAHVDIKVAKQRTTAALEHFASFQDGAPGEVLRSLIETVTGALEQTVVWVMTEVSAPSSATDFAVSTGGDALMSSTV